MSRFRITTGSCFGSMQQRISQHALHMCVSQAVEHVPAGAPRTDKARLAQKPQLVADGRLSHLQRGDNIVHAYLTGAQQGQDP